MYKKLINKGFMPIYYTNEDWFKNTSCKTRLSYRLEIKDRNLLNIILNVLNKYNEYFFLMLNDDLITHIEIEENLESYWIYFYNADVDNIEMNEEMINQVLDILPDKFKFEHYDM